MAPEPRSTAFDGLAFRWSDYDTPLWTRANTSAQRWNRAGEGTTQYVSLTTDGAWAELIRSEELTTVAEVRLVRMPMWGLKVRETHLADYSTFAKAESAGFPPEALVDDDHERCRVEATRLRTTGFRGVLAPSAALPDALNLTLFGPRERTSWDCPDDQRLGSLVPVKQLAVGSPPEELVLSVRHYDTEHTGLSAYRAQRP
jgi:hypothetical protein